MQNYSTPAQQKALYEKLLNVAKESNNADILQKIFTIATHSKVNLLPEWRVEIYASIAINPNADAPILERFFNEVAANFEPQQRARIYAAVARHMTNADRLQQIFNAVNNNATFTDEQRTEIYEEIIRNHNTDAETLQQIFNVAVNLPTEQRATIYERLVINLRTNAAILQQIITEADDNATFFYYQRVNIYAAVAYNHDIDPAILEQIFNAADSIPLAWREQIYVQLEINPNTSVAIKEEIQIIRQQAVDFPAIQY